MSDGNLNFSDFWVNVENDEEIKFNWNYIRKFEIVEVGIEEFFGWFGGMFFLPLQS
jgi:hypothetical protein